MKPHRIMTLLLLSCFLALAGSGCSSLKSFFSSWVGEPGDTTQTLILTKDGEELQASAYTPDSLINYQLGREYAAVGRYELAREHYLLALASANDPGMQNALVSELKSIDMMIKSLR